MDRFKVGYLFTIYHEVGTKIVKSLTLQNEKSHQIA